MLNLPVLFFYCSKPVIGFRPETAEHLPSVFLIATSREQQRACFVKHDTLLCSGWSSLVLHLNLVDRESRSGTQKPFAFLNSSTAQVLCQGMTVY